MNRGRFGNVTWVGMLSGWRRTDLDQIERCISEIHEAIEERLRDFERYVSDEAERGNTDTRDESYEVEFPSALGVLGTISSDCSALDVPHGICLT